MMKHESRDIYKDLVIVGAGMPGLVAAIQAARLGLSVALINDRGYLGGNASAEIRVPVSGADGEQELNFYSREGGILEEIRLENLYRNPLANPYIWDSVLRDFVYREKNIELFLEINIDEVEMKDNKNIEWVKGSQQDSETQYCFHADIFIDDTGNGTIGFMAGAEYKIGREGKEEFGEKIAPDRSDDYVIPSTLTFAAKDVGKLVRYVRPDFALDLTKTNILKHRVIPKDSFYRSQWYYEIGGKLDQIKDIREIVDKHQSLVYGIWDYIKNSGKYDSENYDLEYVACIPGKRESRRLMGDYILKEKDIVDQMEFEDAVGYGGWAIDLHAINGFFDSAPENHWIYLKGIYQIPYRTGYSRNIQNLFFVGRCMSTTHVTFGSTRVMATLCTLAQAIGAAAYLCKEHKLMPRGVYKDKRKDLQQILLREDQYIPGIKNEDEEDKAKKAKINASSVRQCKLTLAEDSIRADWDLGLIFPVVEHIDTISILGKADANTKIRYRIYKPDKKYNYSCDEEVTSGEIAIPTSRELAWIDIPIDADVNEDKLFLNIEKNDKMWFGVVRDSLPGIITLAKLPNKRDRVLDVFTLQTKKSLWKKIEKVIDGRPVHTSNTIVSPYSLCFQVTPTQQIYGPRNIQNGYARPYGLPNIWVSDGLQQMQWIEMTFNQTQSIESIIIYFDSNLDCHIWNIREQSDFNIMPTLVKDYRVYYDDLNQWRLLTQVTDNYKRVNRLQFERLETDKIRIEFLSTNGCPDVRLYEVRVY